VIGSSTPKTPTAPGPNIFVDVDPDDLIADCHPGNNLGAGALGICPG